MGALVSVAGIMLNMIPDDSVFAPSKKIFEVVLALLKPDILPYVIALLLAIAGGHWYMKKHSISFRP